MVWSRSGRTLQGLVWSRFSKVSFRTRSNSTASSLKMKVLVLVLVFNSVLVLLGLHQGPLQQLRVDPMSHDLGAIQVEHRDVVPVPVQPPSVLRTRDVHGLQLEPVSERLQSLFGLVTKWTRILSEESEDGPRAEGSGRGSKGCSQEEHG